MSAGSEIAPLVLTEVIPGIAVVTGDVPQGLELIDIGLIPTADLDRISTAVAALGGAATLGGNLANAVASVQGLFRLGEPSAALLRGGAQLVAKDGANLGTIMQGGKFVAQARFVPVAVNAAGIAAAVGPAVAMIAIQMQLGEITRLVRTNIALTTHVLQTIRTEQWATLTGLAKEIEGTVARVREIRGVPASAWQKISGKGADLETQLDLYRRNVAGHVRQLDGLTAHGPRREFLEANAEAIVFDAFALLTSLKAWTGYQAVHAGWSRAAGVDDVHEAKQFDLIVAEARAGFEESLTEATRLVDALTRELHIIAELPGRASMPLTRSRRSARSSQLTCAQILDALAPLTEVLHPEGLESTPPHVLCVPPGYDDERVLRILPWLLDDGEELRAVAAPFQVDADDALATLGRKALPLDRVTPDMVVAVTDRRVLTAKSSALLKRGEIRDSTPLEDVRYVRYVPGADDGARTSVDLITRDDNIRWLFPRDVDEPQVGALAALLAESMSIPAAERDALLQHQVGLTELDAVVGDARVAAV